MGGLHKNNTVLLGLSAFDILLKVANQIQVAGYFGTSSERDIYFLANTVILFLFTIHYRSVVLIFLPKHVLYIKKSGQEGVGYDFIWIYMAIVSLFLLLIISLMYGMKALDLASHLDVDLLFKILLILSAGFVVQVASSLLKVAYQSMNSFIYPAVNQLFVIVTILLAVHFFHEAGIVVMAWGYLIGNVISFLFLLFGRFSAFIHNLNLDDSLKGNRFFFKEIMPFVLLAFLSLLPHLIEPLFVIDDQTGTISYLGYSYQIVVILLTLLSASVITTFYTRISELHIQGDRKGLQNEMAKNIRLILAISLLVSGYLILYGYELINIFFVRGSFTKEDSANIYRVLRWELLVFVFGSLNLILNRFWYLQNNTKLLFRVATFNLLTYLVGGYILYDFLGYEGLGLALGFSSFVYFAVSIYVLNKKVDLLNQSFFLFVVKGILIVAISVMGISTLRTFLEHYTELTQIVWGTIVYLMLLCVYHWLIGKSYFN